MHLQLASADVLTMAAGSQTQARLQPTSMLTLATRLLHQVMEEIIQKSKAYKALKAQQKEADEKELEDLDAAFKELVDKAPAKGAKAGGLAALLKPPGFEK